MRRPGNVAGMSRRRTAAPGPRPVASTRATQGFLVIHMMARYEVKPEALEQVRAAIARFVASITQHEPDTKIYESFQVWDSTSFVHIMTFVNEAAEERHRTAAYTRAFVDEIFPHCEKLPEFNSLNMIASTTR
jgi:quinol monooxygenase YgiN